VKLKLNAIFLLWRLRFHEELVLMEVEEKQYTDYIDTPIGVVALTASTKGVSQVVFCKKKSKKIKTNSITDQCKKQLVEYFKGQRQVFNLPIDLKGSPFQKSVWACLLTIPFGEYVSYKHIASMLNKPKGAQAVGGANGKNPISLIVPCHRVIGSNGDLVGYAGGLDKKLWLLKHEGAKIIKNTQRAIPLGVNNGE
jgi:methylated-DNA-[protein]-cysteine S-methyltransferase